MFFAPHIYENKKKPLQKAVLNLNVRLKSTYNFISNDIKNQ